MAVTPFDYALLLLLRKFDLLFDAESAAPKRFATFTPIRTKTGNAWAPYSTNGALMT